MSKENLNKRCKMNYVVFVLFCLICVVAIIYCFIHPRGRYICVTSILLVGWGMSLWQILPKRKILENKIQKKTKREFSFWRYPIVMGMIFLLLYLPFGMGFYLFEYFFSTRWPYEYEAEMKELKASGYYPIGVFPDELPESAEEVQWNVVPGMMQAHGFRTLSFIANEGDFQLYKEDAILWYKKEWMELFGIDPAYREGDFERFLEENIIKGYDYQYQKFPVNVPEKVHFTEEELAEAVQYDFGGFSSYHVGIVVIESSNRLVYFEYYP